MNDVLTPQRIENRLRTLDLSLEDATAELIEAEAEIAKTTADLEIAFARRRMKERTRALEAGSKITVGEIEDLALIGCSDQFMSKTMADARVKAARAKVKQIITQIEIARSLGSSVRASMEIS